MKSDQGIKKHVLGYLFRNVTDQKSFNYDLGTFQINSLDTVQLIDGFLPQNNEEIIIENKCTESWFIITTQRVISYYENTLKAFYFSEIDDFTEDCLENVEFFIEAPKLEKLVLKTSSYETVVLEAKAGIQCLVILNLIQRLLKLQVNF